MLAAVLLSARATSQTSAAKPPAAKTAPKPTTAKPTAKATAKPAPLPPRAAEPAMLTCPDVLGTGAQQSSSSATS